MDSLLVAFACNDRESFKPNNSYSSLQTYTFFSINERAHSIIAFPFLLVIIVVVVDFPYLNSFSPLHRRCCCWRGTSSHWSTKVNRKSEANAKGKQNQSSTFLWAHTSIICTSKYVFCRVMHNTFFALNTRSSFSFFSACLHITFSLVERCGWQKENHMQKNANLVKQQPKKLNWFSTNHKRFFLLIFVWVLMCWCFCQCFFNQKNF